MSENSPFPSNTLEALIQQNKTLTSKLEAHQLYISDLQKKLDTQEREKIQLQILESELEAELIPLKERANKLQLENNRLNTTLSQTEAHLAEQFSASRTDIETQRRQLLEARKELSRLRSYRRRIHKHVHPFVSSLKVSLENLSKKDLHQEEMIRTFKKQLQDAYDHVKTVSKKSEADLKKQKEEADLEKIHLQTEIRELNATLAEMKNDIARLRNEATQFRQTKITLENRAVEAERIKNDIESTHFKKLEDAQSRQFVLMSENRNIETELKTLKQAHGATKLANEKAETQCARQLHEIHELKTQIEAQKGIITALETEKSSYREMIELLKREPLEAPKKSSGEPSITLSPKTETIESDESVEESIRRIEGLLFEIQSGVEVRDQTSVGSD